VNATLLRGGVVHSPVDPFATALLVVGDRVAWVGQDGAAATHVDAVDQVVELDGALVTPAFVDAHVHATDTGLTLTGLDLSVTAGAAQVADAVAAHAARRPGEPVLLGHGWDDSREGGRVLSLAALDAAAPGRAVYLARVDVHAALASSALRAQVPGLVSLDGYHATGALTGAAHHAVRAAALGGVSQTMRTAAQRATRERAAQLGIAALHEMAGPQVSSEQDLAGLLALARIEPGPAVLGYWGECGGASTAARLGAVGAAGDVFIDGSLGAGTALLREPYADRDGHGRGWLSAQHVADHLVACTRAGLQAGFHVIGDGAMDVACAGLAIAEAEVGTAALRAGRHRLEHVEMVDTDQVGLLARLGVVASVQPVFDELWGGEHGMYAARLGAARASAMNPWAAMVAAGVPLAVGSDAPVTPLGPWAAVRAAAAHHTPGSRLSARAAFAAHTRGGWRAARVDDAGVLAPGQLASYAVWAASELVVQAPDDRVAAWSTDPRSGVPGLPVLAPDVALPRCLATVVAGTTVHGHDVVG